jgi:hypothetical protein
MIRCASIARRASRWAAAGVVLLSAGGATAGLTIEREAGMDGCTAAGLYFPEDESEPARRARIRCRLETFQDKLAHEQAESEAERERHQQQATEAWMQKQEIPVRLMRPNSLDLFAGGGLTSYGLTLGGLLLPWLEAEAWVGWRSASGFVLSGTLDDSRRCLGGRFKWLMMARGNVTTFVSGGAASCSAKLQINSGAFSPGLIVPGGPAPMGSSPNGEGSAHVVTGTAGVAWMEKSGLRVSLEYVFAYAFYTQATLDDPARPEDETMRSMWTQRLTDDRNGARLQVGYAF